MRSRIPLKLGRKLRDHMFLDNRDVGVQYYISNIDKKKLIKKIDNDLFFLRIQTLTGWPILCCFPYKRQFLSPL